MSDPSELDNPPSWYLEICPAGPRNGFYQKTGMHSVMYVERDQTTLIVSFDNLAEAGGRHLAREPWAGKFVRDNGWSHLSVFAQGPTWFREQSLIDYLEHLRDSGFFARFSKVVFCGTSMGGFGALVFSSLAPGSTVIAFSPQTTLDTAIVPWETRFVKGRRQNWQLTRSDASLEIADAAMVHLVYDPFDGLDRKHTERLSGDNVMDLRAIGCGHKSALVLRRMQQLKPVMDAAIRGTLTPMVFSRLIQKRKDIYLYKKTMVGYLNDRNRSELAEQFVAAFRSRRRKMKRAESHG